MSSLRDALLRRALLIASFIHLSLSQTLLPSAPSAQFPNCAFACTYLQQAASLCLPPAAPATDQTTYISCFCQSGLLAPLYSSPHGVCDAQCPVESDLDTLQLWYKGFCGQNNAATHAPTSTTTTIVTSTRTPTLSSTIAAVPASTSVNFPNSNVQPNGSHKGWFSTHWRYVIMIIVMFVGLLLLALLAVYLKRRHHRKSEEKRASASGLPPASSTHPGQDMWGPHQHMAHTHGWEYTAEPKTVQTEAASNLPSRSGSRRPSRQNSRRSSVHHSDYHNPQLSTQPANMSGAAATAAMGGRVGSKHRNTRDRIVEVDEKERAPSRSRSLREPTEKDIEKEVDEKQRVPSRSKTLREPTEKDIEKI